MMNKSPTEYCDFAFNPVTGCLYSCEYCYSLPLLKRLAGDVRINKGSPQLTRISKNQYILSKPFHNEYDRVIQAPAGITPTLHEYRLPMLAQKKKPANILVCSMADLFGDWVPDEWIDRVFDACAAAPWHNYLFLTKNPQRLVDLGKAGRLPMGDNYWYGTTVNKNGDPFFDGDKLYNSFICAEPLTGELDISAAPYKNAKWVILGAETGSRRNRVIPERRWMQNIVDVCQERGIALFMRSGTETTAVWGMQAPQEMPAPLYREPDIPIPRCRECSHAVWKQDGKRGRNYYCTFGLRSQAEKPLHVEGRYTRTSPPWCKLRQPDIYWEHYGNKKSDRQPAPQRMEIMEIKKQGKKQMKLTRDKIKTQSGSRICLFWGNTKQRN